MVKYRILERQMDGTWTPFGVAYNRGEQGVLFVPAWRKHKTLARPLENLGEEDYPSHTFLYRWREIQTTPGPVSHPIDLLQRAFHPEVVGEVLKIASGSLEGTEVEFTSADRLVITLNRTVPEGTHLKLLAETGEEINLPVVRPLDRQGRAIYDVSSVLGLPPFRLVIVEGEEGKASDK